MSRTKLRPTRLPPYYGTGFNIKHRFILRFGDTMAVPEAYAAANFTIGVAAYLHMRAGSHHFHVHIILSSQGANRYTCGYQHR